MKLSETKMLIKRPTAHPKDSQPTSAALRIRRLNVRVIPSALMVSGPSGPLTCVFALMPSRGSLTIG